MGAGEVFTAIVTLVATLAGVGLANAFTRRESKRRDASETFRRLTENVITAGYAVSHLVRAATPSALQSEFTGEITGGQKGYTDDRFFNAQKEAREVASLLSADAMSIDLLFGRSGQQCIKAIRRLIETIERVRYMDDEERYDLRASVDSLQRSVLDEINPLYQSLRQFDSDE